MTSLTVFPIPTRNKPAAAVATDVPVSIVERVVCRVVIADDHSDVREMLRVMLSVEGDISIVGEACDGLEALQLVGREQPDMLVLDLAMPNLDGFDVIPLVPQYSHRTRVILFSGYSTVVMSQRHRALGTTAHIVKGGGRVEIVDAIRCAWGRRAVSEPGT